MPAFYHVTWQEYSSKFDVNVCVECSFKGEGGGIVIYLIVLGIEF
jgi:hypothetical protein